MLKKRLSFTLLAVLCIALVGCANQTKPTTLPTGAIDQTDATVYRVLTDAQAFLTDIRAGSTSGKLVLSPAQKTTFNALVTSYDATESLWQAYHAKASTDAAGLTASANTLNANLTSAQSTILGAQ